MMMMRREQILAQAREQQSRSFTVAAWNPDSKCGTGGSRGLTPHVETSEKESSGKKRCKNVFAFVLVCVRVCVRVRLCVYACVCVLAQGSAPPCGWHSDCIMTINEKVNGAFSYISYTFGLLPSTMALMTMANVFLWPSKFWIMARPERSTAFSHVSRMWHATFGNISFLQPSGWQLSLAVG